MLNICGPTIPITCSIRHGSETCPIVKVQAAFVIFKLFLVGIYGIPLHTRIARLKVVNFTNSLHVAFS
jgi:hypothetical protein